MLASAEGRFTTLLGRTGTLKADVPFTFNGPDDLWARGDGSDQSSDLMFDTGVLDDKADPYANAEPFHCTCNHVVRLLWNTNDERSPQCRNFKWKKTKT
jgi:hypothetical protein